jgi:hypothetical protein
MVQKTESDLAHFFATDLLKELKALEKMRLEVLARVKIVLGTAAGVFAICVGLDWSLGLDGKLGVISGFICLAAGSYAYKVLTREYVGLFKARVIRRIIEFIDPELTYLADGHVSKARFHSSRIFTRFPDRLRGDDLVSGRVGRTEIEFSEVHAQYKTETTDSKGRKRRKYRTIFKGLFFSADFNKRFLGKTVVLPDTAERLFGGIGGFFQSLNRSRGELVKLENPEFERFFVVYGDDQIESRYVLSTSLVQRILNFRKRTSRDVYLSFVGSEVFVAVPYRRSLFEPRVFGKITGFKGIREYFSDLQLALGIVDDLDLNTRIWTDPQQASPQKECLQRVSCQPAGKTSNPQAS